MPKYLRDPLIWFACFTIIIIFVSPINLLREVGTPYGGFVTGISGQNKYYRIDNATPPWWSGMQNPYNENNLMASDYLVKINQQEFKSNATRIFGEVAENAKRQGNTPFVTLEIIRNEQTLQLKIPVTRLSLSDFLDITLPNFINSLCFLIIGVGVFSLRPNDPVNRIFALTCFLISASQSTFRPAILPYPDELAWIVRALWAFMSSFLGISILHFSTLFPTYQLTAQTRKLLILGYWYSGVVGIAFALMHIHLAIYGFSPLTFWVDSWGSVSILMTMFLGWFFFIIKNYLVVRKNRKQRAQILIILFSVLLGGVYIIPRAFQYFLNDLFPVGIDTRYFLIFIPLGFGIVSLRYKSFRDAWRKPPIWIIITFIILLSALLSTMYSWLWWKISPSIGTPPFPTIFLICLISISLFHYGPPILQPFFIRILSWDSFQNISVQRIGQSLAGKTDVVTLIQSIAEFLNKEFRLEKVSVWLWNEQTNQLELAGMSPIFTLGYNTIYFEKMPNWVYNQAFRLADNANPLSKILLDNSIEPDEWEIGFFLGTDQPIGLIILGQRQDNEVFDEQDLNILEAISSQITLFMFSAKITSWLDKAQEDERFRIAQDLHDTVQQSLHAVSIHLHMIKKLAYRDREKAALFATECQNDIKEAIRNLYEIRYSLNPSELGDGLISPLKQVFERVNRIRGLHIDITASSVVDEKLSPSARRALYRMIKQALDNTLTHAEAKNFVVNLDVQNKKMLFSVVDDGKGSTDQQREHAISSGHLGLKTMRARIESLGGEFFYYSQVGKGTQITGWIPAT